MKTITKEIREQLNAPLPSEAVSPHPSKPYLSTIKAIYVIERLNDVFGVGGWTYQSEAIERLEKFVVVKVKLQIKDYDIFLEAFGGNDNVDLGDAYKGATTDALTKIGSMLEIGIDVFKGLQTGKKHKTQSNTNTPDDSFLKSILANQIAEVKNLADLNDLGAKIKDQKERLTENSMEYLRAKFNTKQQELSNE